MIGELTGEPDVERIAALPLTIIMDWQRYIEWKYRDEGSSKWATRPDQMLNYLKARIPG